MRKSRVLIRFLRTALKRLRSNKRQDGGVVLPKPTASKVGSVISNAIVAITQKTSSTKPIKAIVAFGGLVVASIGIKAMAHQHHKKKQGTPGAAKIKKQPSKTIKQTKTALIITGATGMLASAAHMLFTNHLRFVATEGTKEIIRRARSNGIMRTMVWQEKPNGLFKPIALAIGGFLGLAAVARSNKPSNQLENQTDDSKRLKRSNLKASEAYRPVSSPTPRATTPKKPAAQKQAKATAAGDKTPKRLQGRKPFDPRRANRK